ncbi:MAG: hypothetical protein JXA18_02795 [Chitinispirillaceae bacterium]|nr:hypothetical protein [Chitinispirillaceae bacterium]
MSENEVKSAAGRFKQLFHRDVATIFAAGAVTAVAQTLLVREVFAVVSGNELVIGIMLAIWLAATAAGSAFGDRFPFTNPDRALISLMLLFIAGMTGIRAVRLLLLPGESLTPKLLLLILTACEAPVAFMGGNIFGTLARRGRGEAMYRHEQAGTLTGLLALSGAVTAFAPNYLIAAVTLLVIVPLLNGAVQRFTGGALLVLFLLSDPWTAAWKYPLPVDRITYTHEGETAQATVDGHRITYVNGSLYAATYATPAIEQAVHTPLGMHPHPHDVLIVNSTGHLFEARKYEEADVRCIRTDRLIRDTCCPRTRLEKAARWGPFDAVVLGCGMPDNAATSRFFTRTFLGRMHELVGDSGVYSFTLPFSTEYADRQDRLLRDIIVTTVVSVFRYVKILPGEGITFVASDTDYRLPASCRVANEYYDDMILAGLTQERIETANRPPQQHLLHTAAHPRILLASLERYMERFKFERWMFIAFPVLLVLLLLPALRWTMESVSIGSSGCCTGIYSVALILLYQSIFGTVYAELSLLLLFLAGGFAAGCFVRKFPLSDPAIGIVLGGSLLMLALLDAPPPPLFFLGNAAAGFLTAAQFVTRKTTPAGLLYVADNAGGVLGMALASTILIPFFGMAAIAIGIAVMKTGVGVVAAKWKM